MSEIFDNYGLSKNIFRQSRYYENIWDIGNIFVDLSICFLDDFWGVFGNCGAGFFLVILSHYISSYNQGFYKKPPPRPNQ